MLEVCIYIFWKSNLQWSRLSKVNWMMGNLNQNPTQNLRVKNIASCRCFLDVLNIWPPTTWKIPSQKSYATNAYCSRTRWWFRQVALDFSGCAAVRIPRILESQYLSFTTSITPWWIVFSCEIKQPNRPGSDFLWFRSGTDRATFEGPRETAAFRSTALQTCHEYLECFGGMVSEATLRWGNLHLAARLQGEFPHQRCVERPRTVRVKVRELRKYPQITETKHNKHTFRDCFVALACFSYVQMNEWPRSSFWFFQWFQWAKRRSTNRSEVWHIVRSSGGQIVLHESGFTRDGWSQPVCKSWNGSKSSGDPRLSRV